MSGPSGPTSHSAKLDASVGASGPHDFAVRLGAVRQRRRRVHRIQPRVRDDRDTPLCGVDDGINKTVSTNPRNEIFFDAGLDTTLDSRMTKQPVGQITTPFALMTRSFAWGRWDNRLLRIHSPTAVLSPLADVNVDVEIYFADAGLLRAVRAAFMPAAGMRAGISDISQPQTAPLRKPAAALAGELPCQHDFFAASVGPDDMGTQFTMPAVIAAGDLLLPADRIAEEGVGCARHGEARLQVVVQRVTVLMGISHPAGASPERLFLLCSEARGSN